MLATVTAIPKALLRGEEEEAVCSREALGGIGDAGAVRDSRGWGPGTCTRLPMRETTVDWLSAMLLAVGRVGVVGRGTGPPADGALADGPGTAVLLLVLNAPVMHRLAA
jgi:hypothetical protein